MQKERSMGALLHQKWASIAFRGAIGIELAKVQKLREASWSTLIGVCSKVGLYCSW